MKENSIKQIIERITRNGKRGFSLEMETTEDDHVIVKLSDSKGKMEYNLSSKDGQEILNHFVLTYMGMP